MLSETAKSNNATELVIAAPAGQLTVEEESSNSSLSNATLPPAEKLIRSRRHPAWRHGSKRSKRRRVKGPPPKIRYGPPSHQAGPPISYTHYKSHSLPPSLPPSFATHIEEPSYAIEDFQHLKFDASDFHIPASSYEAQSMDLNLYSHEDNDIYGAHKFPSLEYTFTEDHHDSPPSSSYAHTPHQKYGVPPLQQSIGPSSSYEPESYVSSHHYVPPPAAPATHYGPPPSTNYGAPPSTKYGPPSSTKYGPPPSTKYGPPPATHYAEPPSAPPSSHYGVPAAPPSTQYGVPSAPAHVPSYSHVEPPPPPDSYSIYEQKLPNAGYHEQSFAEPPKAAPPAPAHNSNYEIAYSPPAYEISTSYQAHDTQYEQNYQPPSSAHDGRFAEPPQHAPTPQHTPSYTPQHTQQQPPQHSPPQHPLPQHTPQQHPSSNYVLPEQPVQSYPQDDYALPSEELPINPNPKFPSFDFPKSSYEVPIYDPIPFESSNKEEQESYPPILPDHTSNDLPSDAQTASSSQTTARSRKRKRRPSLVSKKHTLDVPELQQAYDADSSHVQVARGTDLDTVAHGSHYVHHKRNYSSFVTPSTTSTTTTTTPAPWSPMRQRSTANTAFVPTIITSTPSPPQHNRNRGTSRYRSRTASTPTTAVTIEKSRSQSYYDGTIAPPSNYQQQQHQYGRGSSSSSGRPTRPPRGGATGASLALQPGATERHPTHKRTTKGVFDTTLFKSPQSDREMEHKLNILRQNLPKNHKLY